MADAHQFDDTAMTEDGSRISCLWLLQARGPVLVSQQYEHPGVKEMPRGWPCLDPYIMNQLLHDIATHTGIYLIKKHAPLLWHHYPNDALAKVSSVIATAPWILSGCRLKRNGCG